MVSDDISKSRSETTHQDQEDVALSDNIPESIRAAEASLVAASVALISSKHAFYIAKQCEMIPKLVKRAQVLQDRLDNLKREANEAQRLLESNDEMKPSSSTKISTPLLQMQKDVIATGCIGLELLTGRRAMLHQKDPLRNLPADISQTISLLLNPTQHAIRDALKSPLLKDLDALYDLITALEHPKCASDRFEILQHRIQLCARALDRTSIEGMYSTSSSSSSSPNGLLCRVSDEELSIVLPYILRLFDCPHAPTAKTNGLEKKQEASGPKAYAQSKATEETVESECRILSGSTVKTLWSSCESSRIWRHLVLF